MTLYDQVQGVNNQDECLSLAYQMYKNDAMAWFQDAHITQQSKKHKKISNPHMPYMCYVGKQGNAQVHSLSKKEIKEQGQHVSTVFRCKNNCDEGMRSTNLL